MAHSPHLASSYLSSVRPNLSVCVCLPRYLRVSAVCREKCAIVCTSRPRLSHYFQTRFPFFPLSFSFPFFSRPVPGKWARTSVRRIAAIAICNTIHIRFVTVILFHLHEIASFIRLEGVASAGARKRKMSVYIAILFRKKLKKNSFRLNVSGHGISAVDAMKSRGTETQINLRPMHAYCRPTRRGRIKHEKKIDGTEFSRISSFGSTAATRNDKNQYRDVGMRRSECQQFQGFILNFQRNFMEFFSLEFVVCMKFRWDA